MSLNDKILIFWVKGLMKNNWNLEQNEKKDYQWYKIFGFPMKKVLKYNFNTFHQNTKDLRPLNKLNMTENSKILF